MSDPETVTEPYAWLAWLGEKDAHVLLLSLMQAIEAEHVPHAMLRDMVAGWRRNALKALDADDWTAQVDAYLEVRVDARLAVLTKPEGETDEGEGAN